MRRSLGKLSHPAIGQTSRKALFMSSPLDFSTSSEDGGGSGGAGGRGWGRGSGVSKYSFVDPTHGKSEPKSPGEETSSPPPLGHGRGKPSNIPQFTAFGAPIGNRETITGRGRGVVAPPSSEENLKSRTRISFLKEGEATLPPKVPGQSANQEKSTHLGLKKMDFLVQAFEEACAKVFPSPEEEAHVDAMHTNLLLECEPEYLMAEFDCNPDIDENPPIALRDALEKMKPFLMSYENIKTEKEWQDVVEETMKNVPLMKELVDFYVGPNKRHLEHKVKKEVYSFSVKPKVRTTVRDYLWSFDVSYFQVSAIAIYVTTRKFPVCFPLSDF